ncbi:MAG: hypothetical protein EAX90_07990 [Candidatus Heimdallarchaeota archaeon]|nr:hypothetical protein [Candidatus Heimdallarchaeota archaeon]
MMQKQKLNLLFIWFIIFSTLQLSFGLRTTVSQIDLNNRLNIRDEVVAIPLIEAAENITDKLLIFFVDGMRYDRMLDANTPNMDALRANGTTFANFRSVLPSYSRVNYAAFTTGSSTNITNVYSNGYDKELAIPTFYDVISTTNRTLGVATGSIAWVLFLGKNADVITKIDYEYHATTGDEAIKDALLETIDENYSDIQLVTFGTVDGMGHEVGAASPEYIETIENVDSYIGEILDYYQSHSYLENTTIVLFSDHGMADIGGHGDDKDQQTHATLILAGKGIKNKGKIENDLVKINSVAPTILTMFGLPLTPTMNGKILYGTIDVTNKTKAQYEIQIAEIMKQQLEVSLDKIKLISKNSREVISNRISRLQRNITDAKIEYNLNSYETAFSIAKIAENDARFFISSLYYQLNAAMNLMRNLVILGIITIILFTIFFLNQRKIIEISSGEVFTKELILPEIISAFITLGFVVGMFLIFGFGYSATHFNSAPQALIPNLTAFGIIIVLGIFQPWLFTYLFGRKKYSEFTTFKDWNSRFLRTSIGTIAFLSLPVVGFMMFYISKWGPWPTWYLPKIGHLYAFMVIPVLSSIFYIVAIIFIIVLRKKEKSSITKEKLSMINNDQ